MTRIDRRRQNPASQVVERGIVHGLLVNSIPAITGHGTQITSLLIATKPGKATWYEVRGHQPYLMDDARLNQIVEFSWERYEHSSRRYVSGQVVFGSPEPLGALPGSHPHQAPAGAAKCSSGMPKQRSKHLVCQSIE